jgi:soluble lytic murein transglycosylase-like protein
LTYAFSEPILYAIVWKEDLLEESLLTWGRRLLSLKTLRKKSSFKFLITFPLIVCFSYVPLAYLAYQQNREQVVAAGYWDVVLLEFDTSAWGEIYRLMQRYDTGLTDIEEAQLAAFICAESQRYQCDPKLVLALIIVESSFDSKATSPKGAKGLMQLLPPVAKDLAQEVGIALTDDEQAIYDPAVNIRLGLYYLSKLILQFKDLKVALAAYNFGPGYVRERIELGMPLPTEYADRVIRKYHVLTQAKTNQSL